MSHQALAFFAAAIAVLFAAHVLRATRHLYLFPPGEIWGRFPLLLALSLGYALNAIFPWRFGEIVRALFITIRLRLRFGYVAATVVAERLSDLVCVAAILTVVGTLYQPETPGLLRTALAMGAGAIVMIVAAIFVSVVPVLRRSFWRVASIFNDSIRLTLAEFVWTVSSLVREGQLTNRRYLAATVGMWTLYLSSYALFAHATSLTVPLVMSTLLGAPLQSLSGELLRHTVTGIGLQYLMFTFVPVAVIVGYGVIRHGRAIGRSLAFAQRYGLAHVGLARAPVSQRFRESRDYAAFLNAHFATQDEIVADFAVRGIDDAIVHRLLPGGSDAITAVVEVNGVLGIRKFANASSGTKLETQARWLREHGNALPLADVLNERREGAKYLYDMPFLLSARDFYDVIHTVPVEASQHILRNVVANVAEFHTQHASGEATETDIARYLEEKVIANAKRILTYARVVVEPKYTVNGNAHDLSDWDYLLNPEWLRRQIQSRATSVVHGDLTIENIIVCPERENGWYLIDPNSENVFDTPLIDWAKLMQSLHLGYEGLNRNGVSSVQNNAVRIVFAKSSMYAELHNGLTASLCERLGVAAMREVAFHELVHYLRLTPYKIRHSPQKGLTFFTCTAVLLRRYLEDAKN